MSGNDQNMHMPTGMEKLFERLLEPPQPEIAELNAKLDRVIALLEAQPESTAILTGKAVRDVLDTLPMTADWMRR